MFVTQQLWETKKGFDFQGDTVEKHIAPGTVMYTSYSRVTKQSVV